MLFKETKFPVLKQPKVAFLKGARLPSPRPFSTSAEPLCYYSDGTVAVAYVHPLENTPVEADRWKDEEAAFFST